MHLMLWRPMRRFPPERIVCLTEETVETLYLLGEQDRIVGVSGYAVLLHRSAARSRGSPLSPVRTFRRSWHSRPTWC
jgi:ABC-type Fe3+-hydroxamate transport system substrate-binding protein